MQIDPRLKTKLETALSVFAVGAVGVVGGMLTTSGTLPATWDQWRPILAAGLAAGVASEITWVKTLLKVPSGTVVE